MNYREILITVCASVSIGSAIALINGGLDSDTAGATLMAMGLFVFVTA